MLIRFFLLLFSLLALIACQEGETPTPPPETTAPTSLPAPAITIAEETATPSPAPLEQQQLATPVASATPTLPPATPTFPPPTPTRGIEWQLGQSGAGAPMLAQRVGDGPVSLAIVGLNHPVAAQLLAHFQANPTAVPPGISLWFLPELNLDGPGEGVDLRRNAQTTMSGCEDNGWSPDPDERPGMGGAHPFSEPESQALDELARHAWMVLFLEGADSPNLGQPRIVPGGCRHFAATTALEEALSSAGDIAIARALGNSGNWIDYLTGEGIASARIELPAETEMERILPAIEAILRQSDDILDAPASVVGADLVWLDDDNLGQWRFSPGALVHPLAVTVLEDDLVLLDGGQVIAVDIEAPDTAQRLLQPGDMLANDYVSVPSQDPLDLIAWGNELLVLDRVADIYRYQAGVWTIERYDRPISETSSHYFTAIAANGDRFLLESSYDYVNRYTVPYASDTRWLIDEHHDVDLAVYQEQVYLLYRELASPAGGLVRYLLDGNDTSRDQRFRSDAPLYRPRAAAVTANTLYILDQAGYRLLALDPISGKLRRIYQFAQRQAVSAIWASPDDSRLILAGKDHVYFLDEPQMQAEIRPLYEVAERRLHDPAVLRQLRGLLKPVAGTPITQQDLQMPGAPRHYRLGVHEGLDFYWALGTSVRAPADGTVVRAMHDYVPASDDEIEHWRTLSWGAGYTPQDALDAFRGRQVWIEHPDGTVSRYAHLDTIDPDVVVGAAVQRGQTIGTVGNSGSPGSIVSEDEDAHLHFELWLDNQYLGQYLSPIEIREWLEMIFTP